MDIRNYHLFDVTDFVLDDAFMRWVYEPTAEDEAFWSNWLKQHPDKQLAVAEARQIVQSIRMEPEKISNQMVTQEVEKLLDTIKGQRKKVYLMPFLRKGWYAAACLLILAGSLIGVYYAGNRNTPSRFSYKSVTASRHLVEQVNTSGKVMRIVLPDSSIVTLSPKSRISYDDGFDSTATRDVYLFGEAFFEVTKDALHPFRVFANEIITKVLGTSFKISSFDKEKDIEITVRTGRVSVYSQLTTADKKTTTANKLDGIIITPNQLLIYKKEQQKFEKELLEKPVIIAPDMTPQNMIYEDAPLVKVLRDIRKAYGITLIYDAELLKNCTLTADLSDEALYTKLDLICKAIGGWYEVTDAQVIIRAGGCS